MIAALPMYDFPELRAETDLFWQGLRSHLAASGLTGIPQELTYPDDLYGHWLDPDLLLTQTCGFPMTHRLRGRVRYVATPGYAAPGCEDASYCSFVITRDGGGIERGADLSGRVAAINGEDSQSGCNILKLYLAGLGLINGSLRDAIESGSHRNSVAFVKSGRADFCSIDCVSWALLGAVAPEEVEGLRVLDQTASAPCLPFITSRDMPVDNIAALRAGLSAAFTDPGLAAYREKLLLEMVTVLDEEAYDLLLVQELAAQRSGWSQVA